MRSDYDLGQFTLRVSDRQLLDRGVAVPLGGRAFEVLAVLVEHAGKLVTKEQLFERAWPGVVVEENNLQVQISTLRKALGQGAITTVTGQGYRLTLEVKEAGPVATPSPAPRKHNLPQPLTNFIGHEQDLIACAELVERTRLLTLTGIGGCGKTRFAIKLAEQVLPAFPDGAWFVDLAPVAEAAHVPFTVATRLRIREIPDVPLEETLGDQLANRQLLLILDNCEHLVECCAQLAQRLLEAAPGLRILATSRESLGVVGEQIVTVRSLMAPPSSADHDIDALASCESVHLFVERARSSIPAFKLTADIGPSVADVCRRLDGIPLAIELAAARVSVLSVEQIRSRLNDRFRLLVGGARALPRHRTLDAVMQWSYEHLAPRERQLIRRLSVFAGGWTLDAAMAMAGSPSDQGDVLTLLSGLIDKSLIEVERHGNEEPRYRMLETVRQYMIDRLEEVGETSVARARHLNYFLSLAEAVSDREFSGQAMGSFVPQLSRELDNILAAHASCDILEGGAELGLRLVIAVGMYWIERRFKAALPPAEQDPISLGYRMFTEALARSDAQARTLSRCRALNRISNLCFLMRRYDEAEALLAESTAIARQLNDHTVLAMRSHTQAFFHLMRNEFDAAQSCAEESLVFAVQSKNNISLWSAVHAVGEVSLARGALAEAEVHHTKGLALARESCPEKVIATSLVSLAWVLLSQGGREKAAECLREAIPTIIKAGNTRNGTVFLIGVVGLAAVFGADETAARLCGAVRGRLFEAALSPILERRLTDVDAELKRSMDGPAYDAVEAGGSALGYQEALEEAGKWLESIRA